MFSKVSTKDLDEFSRSLARELSRQFESDERKGPPDKKAERKRSKALDRIYAKALEFKVENKLGVYGKARLGNTFKWELKELGYEDAFVDEATKGLLLNLSRK